jgi:hypothetical protein
MNSNPGTSLRQFESLKTLWENTNSYRLVGCREVIKCNLSRKIKQKNVYASGDLCH